MHGISLTVALRQTDAELFTGSNWDIVMGDKLKHTPER